MIDNKCNRNDILLTDNPRKKDREKGLKFINASDLYKGLSYSDNESTYCYKNAVFKVLFQYEEKLKKREFDERMIWLCEELAYKDIINREEVILELLRINGEVFGYIPDYDIICKIRNRPKGKR